MKNAAIHTFLAVLLVLGSAAPSHAQNALNIGNLLAAQQRAMNADLNESEESSAVIGIAPTAHHRRAGGMSEAEIQAFLNGPRNWFRAVGKGGAPTSKPIALDNFAKILNPSDEATYKKIFAAIGEGDMAQAAKLATALEDRILIGHIDAARYLDPKGHQPTAPQLRAWLDQNSDLPEAVDIYEKAKKIGLHDVVKPTQPPLFSGSIERADGGGTMEWNASGILKTLNNNGRAAAPFAALVRANKTEEAIKWLATHPLPEQQALAANLTLAEVLLRQGRGAMAYGLIKDADTTKAGFDSDAFEYALWIKGLCAWTAGDYAASYQAFNLLSEQNLPGPNKAGAAFWGARAAEKTHRAADRARLIDLAGNYPRSFYGLLALSRSNKAPDYNWALPDFNKRTAERLKAIAGGRRALALLQLGERTLAEAELRGLSLAKNPQLQTAVLALAGRYALPGLSVQIGSALSAGTNKLDGALYPLMPWYPENGYAADPALVLAVARNESHFDHTARSPVGATGLMQIMPDTANAMRAGAASALYDPAVNVTLGDRYLELLSRTDGIDNNLLFIIGGYNAGPKRILGLHESSKSQNAGDPLLFVETLPIKETRDYIQKVMATYWVYRARFNKPLTAIAELTVGRWPRYNRGNLALTMSKNAE